jgi:mannan endo-1,4-beta-mannosidase
MIIPGGEKHEFYKQRLDVFADFLNDLKVGFGTKIPIIFRPFHEHTGNWFWWGKGNCTSQEYIALWQFTVKYLRDIKGIHHLLYSYSTDQFDTKEQYLEFYPGDDFVDIIAFDDYHSVNNFQQRERLIYRLKTVVELAESRNKIAAFSETGSETIPQADWFTNNLLEGIKADDTGRRIAYVMVWRNAWPHHHYAPYPGHASAPDFVKFRQDPYTIFEDDLPKMYRMPK